MDGLKQQHLDPSNGSGSFGQGPSSNCFAGKSLEELLKSGTPEDIFSAISHFVPFTQDGQAVLQLKALSFLEATLRAVKWYSVRFSMPVTVDMIKERLPLEPSMIMAGFTSVKKDPSLVPEDIIKPLRLYLTSAVPGFDPAKPFHEQDEEVFRHHGVIQKICLDALLLAAGNGMAS